MGKLTALAEVVEAAEKAGWIVQVHPVTRFITRSARDRATTAHDDIVVEILPSEAMRGGDSRSVGYGDTRNIIALFRQSGAFHTAFRSVSTWTEIEAEAEEGAERVTWERTTPKAFSPERVEQIKAFRKAEKRYGIIARSRIALTKTKLLEAIEQNPLVLAERRKATQAKQQAERREQEIKRLTEQVIPNNERIVAEATYDALESLETVKDAVRATHPLFQTAPGLLDSVVLAVLGVENHGTPAVAFIHARARIEQAQAEIDKAKGFLAQSTQEVSA